MRKMMALLLALLLALGPVAVMASDDVATKQLIDQAQYWEKKGDDVRAAQAWQKLLRVAPDNAVARAGMMRIDARRGAVVAVGQPMASESSARAVASGPSQLKPSTTRPQAYGSLAGTAEGWGVARSSLEALARSNPDDSAVRFELAKVLTYRQATRHEGIRMLAALAQSRPDDQAIREAWRQALTWLGNSANERQQLEAFLARFPDDQSLRERLRVPASGSRISAAALARSAGFAALDQGEHAKAEAAFRQVLATRANDAEALGGLGVIYLRREDFVEASRLLERALALGGKQWQSAARSAQYWRDIEAARAARTSGHRAEAERLARSAMATDQNQPEAAVLLADLLAEGGDSRQAETAYREVLRRHPGHEGAFRGLLGQLAQAGRIGELQALVAELKTAAGADVANAQARAALMLRESEVLTAAGDNAGAAAILEDALVRDPGSYPVRAALARAYQHLGRDLAAAGLLDSSLDADAAWSDGWFAKAQVLASQKRWLEALYAMERIPPGERDEAMVAEQNRFWVHARVERAVAMAGDGQAGQGLELLMDAEQRVANNPSALAAVASAWVDFGQPTRALAMARRLLSGQREPDVALQVTYAGLLLRVGETDEAALMLRHLSEKPLSDEQLRDVNALIRAYTMRHADGLREQGRYAEAFDVLRPLFEAGPDNVLQMALARLHLSAGDAPEALTLAESVLETESRSIDHQLFAAGAAMAAANWQAAEKHIAVAQEIAPEHPRVFTLRGQLANARGDRAEARVLFEQAVQAERFGTSSPSSQGLLSLRLVESTGAAVPAIGAPVQSSLAVPRQRLLPIPGASSVRSAEPARMPAFVIDTALPSRIASTASRSRPIPAPMPQREPSFSQRPVASSPSEAERSLAALRAESSRKLEAGIEISGRSGESGLGQLDRSELVLQGHWPVDWGGTFSASVTAVGVDAGPLDVRAPFVVSRFGSNALGAFIADPPVLPVTREGGVAGALAYRDRQFAVDVGVTPVGFTLNRVVGGASVSHEWADWRLQGTLERRAVTDSLLSWNGLRDSQSQSIWGAVTRSGARVAATLGDADGGAYGSLGRYRFDGRGVARNDSYELGLGGYLKLWHYADSQATLGVHIEVQGYEKNLSYFTLGHGGYFSPQRFASISFPFTASGQRGKLTYQWGSDIGIRYIRQDAAPYFPNDPALQLAWEQRLRLPGMDIFSSHYSESADRGLGVNLHSIFEYRVLPDLAIGGRLHWDNSRDFSRFGGLLYLRYGLDGLPDAMTPPQSLRPIENGIP